MSTNKGTDLQRDLAYELVQSIARLTKDGELVNGEKWAMPSDDAHHTVDILITNAREIVE